jgi:fructokinase
LAAFRRFGVPLAFDTDVNGAAFGEWAYGAARDLDTFCYYTIGTGIGAGGMIGGRLMHGLTHPEAGHIRIPHDTIRDPFEGICPSHKDCFEGLASGPAIEKRWGARPSELPPTHPAWELEASYIAIALANTICTLSPQRIILGGGVMQHELLFPLIRLKVVELLNGYIQHPSILENIATFIVPPSLGTRSGVLGSAAMAFQALSRSA